ncbi:hypothetical protein [Sneathiella sp.]|uniref:hypothetical protein n=1 Tax=Sneathiella sp. TaxID=1964365 RepID=UPI002FE077B2
MVTTNVDMLLNLRGNVAREARRNEMALAGMAKRSSVAMGRMNGTLRATSKGLDALGNRYSAILSGAAAAGAIKYIASLEKRYEMLGIAAGRTSKQMIELREQIFETARAPDIRIGEGELFAAVDEIYKKTGDLEAVTKNMQTLARLIRASGATGAAAGALGAGLIETMGIRDPKAFEAAVDTLLVQGQAGGFELDDLAALGPRIISMMAGTGNVGVGGARELGALMQMSMRSTGTPEMAATAFERYAGSLLDGEIIKKLEGVGLKIFEDDDPDKMRSLVDITKELMTLSGGDELKLGQVFDIQAMRAIRDIAREYRDTKDFKTLDSFLAVGGDGSKLMEDATRAAQTMDAALTSLSSTIQNLADKNLSGPIKGLADAINALDPDRLDTIFKTLIGIAGAVGGLVIINKLIKGGMGIVGMAKGMRSGGLAGAVGAVGVQKVFVVNMGMGGMGGGMGNPRRGGVAAGAAGAAAAAGTTGGLASRLTSLFKGGSVSGLKGLFTRVPVLGALIAGAAISGTALADDLTGAEKARGIGGDLGALGGALGGSALGASIGSVVPGLGTLLGGIVGGVLGGFGGQFSGEQIAELLTELIDVTKENGEVNVDVAVNPNAGGPVVRATAARRARRGTNVHAGPPMEAGGW